MNKRSRKKQALQRAAPMYPPGGGLMYVPAGQQQGVLGQTFYGTTMKNVPVSNTPIFSPGIPLPAQPGVDPLGKPTQFRFPVSYNTFPVDRSLGLPDIPSFEQLRRFARMYSGCTLNERYWLDLVPRMTLDIRIKKEYADQGAEAKSYQKQIAFFKNFWEKPDGRQDIHTWLRKALREQTQIDELYLYKNRTRGRKLLGLWIVSGDQMKPLLDDWGMVPESPDFAFQQYPWGIPGRMYSTDMMIHYQETPAAETPYGFSRVERVILEVNQALRKKRKDLANFTEGNIPQSFMEVPESLNWTPDQIDSYEQSWNALLAGNAQQQIRMKFLQPGMKYIPADQYQMLTDFDLFLFRVTCGCYGVPPTEFGFTDDANRATGESQEDLVYRRTIGPNASTYARIMTQCMDEDFPPEMNGEMFEAVFTGYEEVEDEGKKATANTTYTGAGVLGLTDAAKLGNLPIDPGAAVIGRILETPNGPIFLDDKEFMDAWRTAQMAGFKMAANPPQPPPAPGGAPQPGGNQPDNGGSDAGDNEVDQAMDEADKSLGQLSRSDPVHGFHGEFGFDGGPQQHTTGSGRHGGHHGGHGHKGSGHHTKGAHMAPRDRMQQRAQKLAARFAKLENRKLGRHWSAAQSKAAGALEDIFNKISHAMAKGGQQQSIDHLLDKAFSQAKTLFAGKPKGLGAMSRALTRIDKANDSGMFRTVDAEDLGDEESDFSDLDDALDELEIDEQEALSRVADALEQAEEAMRLLRARNVTPEEDYDVTRTQSNTEDEAGSDADPERAVGSLASAGAQYAPESVAAGGQDRAKAISQEYRRWREVAIKDVRAGKPVRHFVSEVIPHEQQEALRWSLSLCTTPEAVRAVFPVFHEQQPMQRDASPKAYASASGGHPQSSKSAWKLRW